MPLIEVTSDAPPTGRSRYRLQLRSRQQHFLETCVLDVGACSEMPDVDNMGDAERRILEIREYFINEFAKAEGHRGGEFFTPRPVARLLVEMLEPYEGRVLGSDCRWRLSSEPGLGVRANRVQPR